MKKRKEYDDDDGRTIANMNVDGMPWYNARVEEMKKENGGEFPDLTFREKLSFYAGALKAAFLVILCFAGMFFLLILFLLFIWN